MRVVVDTNVFVSAALKEQSFPGMAARIVAAHGRLLKSTVTERELFITLARPRLAPLIPLRFRDWLSELLAAAELLTEHGVGTGDVVATLLNNRAELVVTMFAAWRLGTNATEC